MSPYSWVIWNYRWKPPKRGKFQTVVRATDTKGQLQIAEIVRPQPAGASGLHTIIPISLAAAENARQLVLDSRHLSDPRLRRHRTAGQASFATLIHG